MTIIFPLEGTWDGSSTTTAAETTKAPDTWSGNDANYDGFFSSDDYTHYEIFTTATPEPDSAGPGGSGKWAGSTVSPVVFLLFYGGTGY